MAYPQSSSLRRRPDLEETYEEFSLAENMTRFIGTDVMPVKEVPIQAGTFGYLEAKVALAEPDQSRIPTNDPGEALRRLNTGDYVQTEFKFKDDKWATIEDGIEERVDHREAAQFSSYLQHEATAAVRARHAVLLQREIRIARRVTDDTGLFASNPGTKDWQGVINAAANWGETGSWSTAGVVADIHNAVLDHYFRNGVWPDTMVMSLKVFKSLRNVQEIVDRISSQGAGDKSTQTRVTIAQLQECFDMPNILVGGGTRDANGFNENTEFSPEQIWQDKYITVYKRSTGTGPSRHARTWTWQNLPLGGGRLQHGCPHRVLHAGRESKHHDPSPR